MLSKLVQHFKPKNVKVQVNHKNAYEIGRTELNVMYLSAK
jgi:hypothetical protein